MKFSPKKFNRFLNGIGQDFLWYRSFSCPCTNSNSGAPRRDCPQCSGKGVYWESSVEAKAGVVSRGQLKKFGEMSEWDSGDLLLVIQSDSKMYKIGQFDRVDTANRTEPFSVNIVNNFAQTVRFRIHSVDKVTWFDSDTLIVGAKPSVNRDGALSWVTPPPAGVTYSISGRRYPAYYCYMDLPLDRPYHFGADLPRRVVLRRFDLFGR